MSTIKRSRHDLSSLYRAWRRRPLSGLRWQLTIASSLLLAVVVIVYSTWISEDVEHATNLPAASPENPSSQSPLDAVINVRG